MRDIRNILAPAFYIFPPSKKVSKEDKLDVQAVGYQAESMAKWLKDRSDVVIRVYRPPNHSGTGFLILMTLFGQFSFVKSFRKSLF